MYENKHSNQIWSAKTSAFAFGDICFLKGRIDTFWRDNQSYKVQLHFRAPGIKYCNKLYLVIWKNEFFLL